MKEHFGFGRLVGFLFNTICLIGMVVSLAGVIRAQTDTGRVEGTIKDQQDAVIPGALVSITNTATGAVYKVTSDAAGNFSVPVLPRGNYQASVTATGFEAQTATFELAVSQVQALNFKLVVGAASTTVEVNSAAPLVETDSSSTGIVVEGRQLSELPLNGRNFTQLALLSPGVTRGAYGSAASGVGGNAETFRNGETGGAALAVNGLRPQANNFILDGVDNNESLVNSINFYPPVEAMAEFRVNTSVAQAEFGRAGGAVIQTSLKSGTNNIHGSVFEFIRNSVFDASPNYFSPTTPKAAFKRNQFGGTLGFPILRDKLFLFGDYQGLRQDRPLGVATNTVPTAKMRTGDFSELLVAPQANDPTTLPLTGPGYTTCSGITKVFGAIYDPTTCKQWNFNGHPNVIDPSRINKAGLAYLNAFPAPNPGNTNIENNYTNVQHDVRHFNDFDGRIDYNLSAKNILFARYSYGQDEYDKTVSVAGVPSGFASGNNINHPRGVAAGFTHLFTSNIVNDFRFGYSRPFFGYINPFEGVPFSQNLGIQNANRNALLGGGALIGGFNSEISYTGDGGPYEVPQKSYQYLDTLSWARGRHNFRFGGSVIQRQVDFFQGNSAKGFFNIGQGTGDFTGYEVSELLAGFIDTYQISNSSAFFNTTSYETGYFGQDDWKVNNRLVLNLGLRYDLYTFPYEQHNQQSNFDIASGQLLRAGVNGNSRSLVNTNFNNFAPRIGFAYDVGGSGRTVVRGGYGIFYFLDRGGVGNELSNNPEFNGTSTYHAQNGYRITFTGQNAANLPPSSNCATNATFCDNNSLNAAATLPEQITNINEAAPTNASVIAYPKNNPTSMIQQWNIQVEQQIDPSTVFDIAYVGTKSDHLANALNYTNNQLGTGLKFFQPQGLNVTLNANGSTAHYNGLQTRINRRLQQGLQFTVAYTWSHATDNSAGSPSETTSSNIFIDATGPRLDLNRGNAVNDQRHAFTGSALYELPFGHGKQFGGNVNRALDYLVGGWQVNPFVSLGTGTPFYVSVNAPSGSPGPSNRPDLVGNPNAGERINVGQGFQYINLSAFAAPPKNAAGNYFRPGTVQPYRYYGPGYKTLNLSAFKNFKITERVLGQFRAEAFNLTNTPQFPNPADTNISDAPSSNGGFGVVNSTRDFSEREVQFALRFTF
jgi:hypothetical protein